MQIPREKSIDSTFALLREGYGFVPERCERLQSDVFQTRLMLRKAICVMGEEAAAMFYQPGRFTRQRAMPLTTLMLLQDRGSVQLQEGAAHGRRKQMFMSMMSPAHVAQLCALFEAQWKAAVSQWARKGQVVLHHEAEQLLCRAVCQWAGVPLTEVEARKRAREFSAMIDGAGSVGLRNWTGMLLRSRTENWARHLIGEVRAGRMPVPEESPLHVIAWHRDANGRLLDVRTAAVELLNLLRPTVAVARYVTFAALALHQYPQYRQRIQAGDDDYLECFVQEVRRFYPFFPVVGGRVREEFDWRGVHFARGTWVLLDLYGTNHDPRIWGDPQAFRPERFRDWNQGAFNFVPQGAGDVNAGHRCPGERITIEIVKTAASLLTHAMNYEVPLQDLRIDLARMPAIPASRFIIGKVQEREGDRQEAGHPFPLPGQRNSFP